MTLRFRSESQSQNHLPIRVSASGRGCPERHQKQRAQKQINAPERQVARVHALLHVEYDRGNSKAQLFEDCGNHHQPETPRVLCDDEERELPGQRHAGEPIIKTGVRDRRRILASDRIEKEIERRQRQHTPYSCAPKNDFREFHFGLVANFPGVRTPSRRTPASRAASKDRAGSRQVLPPRWPPPGYPALGNEAARSAIPGRSGAPLDHRVRSPESAPSFAISKVRWRPPGRTRRKPEMPPQIPFPCFQPAWRTPGGALNSPGRVPLSTFTE